MATQPPAIEPVTFRNEDMAWEVAALILHPPGSDENKSHPTIVSVHPFGGCKAQISSEVYGKRFAEAGSLVIAFDASDQGASGGTPCWIEDPTQWVEDISHVIEAMARIAPVLRKTRLTIT